jgi:hypothetical protein
MLLEVSRAGCWRLTSTKGYDDTTGLGTPNGNAFLLGEALLP